MHHTRRNSSLLSIAVLFAMTLLVVAGCDRSNTDDTQQPSTSCCDPAAEPGTGDNPTCIEGATCCADGSWQCNEGDGSNTCAQFNGVCESACDPALEPGTGNIPPCIEGATCCPDGTWQCNFNDPVCPG